eukprot:1026380-Rhodomonas_salina.4
MSSADIGCSGLYQSGTDLGCITCCPPTLSQRHVQYCLPAIMLRCRYVTPGADIGYAATRGRESVWRSVCVPRAMALG